MSASNFAEPTVGELRTRAEQNRARLTGTVEELRIQVADTAAGLKERLSPSAIKNDFVGYARGSRDQLWDKVQHTARQNPLQAVAVGAVVAYPVIKLLRSAPAPLLLIGAGLFLSRASPLSESLSDAASQGRVKAQGAIDKVGAAIEGASDVARRSLNDKIDTTKSAVDSFKDRASATVHERVQEATDGAKVGATDTLNDIKSQAAELVQEARKSVSSSWDKNPLVIAGIGLGIGAVLAAAFPATKAEDSVLGNASDSLRRAAAGVAVKGVNAVQDVVEKTTKSEREDGISGEGVKSAGEAVTDKLRAVAEKGVAAAFNQSTPSGPSVDQTSGKQS